MTVDLWVFLSVGALAMGAFLTAVVITGHKRKMKELEIEALKIQKANLQAEVEKAVSLRLGDQLNRIEVLEAIVTDKNYELSEKITRLK